MRTHYTLYKLECYIPPIQVSVGADIPRDFLRAPKAQSTAGRRKSRGISASYTNLDGWSGILSIVRGIGVIMLRGRMTPFSPAEWNNSHEICSVCSDGVQILGCSLETIIKGRITWYDIIQITIKRMHALPDPGYDTVRVKKSSPHSLVTDQNLSHPLPIQCWTGYVP